MKKIKDERNNLTLSETPYIEFIIPRHFTQTTESMQFSYMSWWIFKVKLVTSDFSHL
ncbi:hypothetical protein LguiB_009507 [Lonicera macranthoides]